MPPKLLATLLLATTALVAQTPPPQTPTYDIVSIHRNKSDTGNFITRPGKTSFAAENVTLGLLLYQAYHIGEDHTSGLTGPVASARFDLVAKVSDASPDTKLTPEQRRTMMAALLADRFKLRAHIESKTLPIYELIVLPGGPRFKPAPEGAPGPWSFGPRSLKASAANMSNFIDILSNNVDRAIVDKTGLTGKYDLTLKWAPEGTLDAEPQSQDPPLFTALQEQLGLKLRPTKGPVDTLVVDHVEMPSEN